MLKNQIIIDSYAFSFLVGIYFAKNTYKSKQMEVIQCL
jgi:hypothetical protein